MDIQEWKNRVTTLQAHFDSRNSADMAELKTLGSVFDALLMPVLKALGEWLDSLPEFVTAIPYTMKDNPFSDN